MPLLYATLSVAPPLRPYSALVLLVTTLNSATASGDGCTVWFENPWLLVPYALLSRPSSRKLLNVLRMPFTLNEPSRGVPPVLNADTRTPGLSSASDEYSRPFSGSSTACLPVMSWPRWLESVSRSIEVPTTWTVSVSWPGASCRSTRWRAPTVTWMLSATAVEKPWSSAVTL